MKTRAGKFLGWLLLAAIFSIGALVPHTASAAAEPTITTQPISQSLLAGTNATLSVVASGQATLFYQWSLNGTNLINSAHISGATNTALIISNLTAGDAGNYQVVVSNSHGTATSSNATLTVLLPPSITSQPTNKTVVVPNGAGISVTASGTAPLSYQWFFNLTQLVDDGNVTGSTTPNLNIADLRIYSGFYQVVVTNNYGATTSQVAFLTVLVPAYITSQPIAQAVLLNGNATFTAQASGTAPFSYQWQKDGVDLLNGGAVNGATTATLSLTGIQTNDAGMYQVVATNNYGSSTSAVAALTVLVPANITVQPVSQAVVLSSNVIFSAAAAGTAPLIYQWYFNGTPLANGGRVSGSTTANLIISGSLMNDAGSYQLIVTNNYGSATSAVASLTVIAPPSLTAQPTNRVARLWENITISAAATGTAPLNYRWQKDGTNLADGNGLGGTGTSSLVISNTQMSHVGNYRILMTNAYGIAISQPASLSVVPIMAWGNDPATSVPLTLTNPLIIAAGANHGLCIKSDGTVEGWGYNSYNMETPPPGLSNVVAVAAGSWDYCSLALKNDGTLVSWGNPSYTNLPAGLTNVVAIAVGNNHSLALRSDGTVVGWGDNYNNKATPPVGLSNVIAIAAGASHSLALKSDGTLGWGQFDQNMPDGVSNIIAISAGAGYSMVLRNDGTMFAWGNNYYGQVNWYHTNVTGISAVDLHGFAIQRDKTIVGWGYDRYGEGTPPAGLSNVVAVVGGTYFSVAQVESPIAQVAPTIWWQPTNIVQTSGQAVELNPYIQGSLPMNYQWYFNGFPLTGETNKWLVMQSIQPGQAGNYHIVASNISGSVTSSVVAVNETPGFSTQPANQSSLLGSNANFSASVLGIEPLSYQWLFNGIPLSNGPRISGSATTNLSITGVQTNDGGNYQLVVTNSYGTATSTSAVLTILFPPSVITPPTNRTVAAGATATFTVESVGTAPLSFQWYSNGVAIVNGGRFTGATTSTLNIFSTLTNDSANYHVIVTNNYGTTTSLLVTLTVQTPVKITSHPSSQAILLGSPVNFPVGAVGSTSAYRWYFNGAALTDGGRITGSTTPVLTINNIQPSDAGGYIVVITNTVSSATSRTASLTPQAVLSASTRYVRTNNPTPQTPFLDWSAAATNIQDAIDAAVPGDSIVVSNGTYNFGGRAMFAAMTNRVVIDKAVTIQSVNGPAATTIAGLPGTGSYLSSGYRCVYLTNGAALIGFTLTNGATRIDTSYTDLVKEQYGAGVWCESLAATISNCVITRCYANKAGGGIYQGTVYNSMVTNCGAFNIGGGTYASDLNNCIIASNRLVQGTGGGGTAYGVVSNCLIVWNSASSGGGAYFSTLTSCVVSNNSGIIGGGVFFGVINNCLISSNRSSNYGGGAYSNVLINCLIKNNYTSGNGAGAFGSVLVNCTVISNSTPSGSGAGGGIYGGNASNSIVYYNFSNKDPNFPATMSMNYCCTPTIATNGVGNITNAPFFVNLSGADFHLQSNSPCINAGNNAYVTTTTDFDGNPRLASGTVDIGAYEFQSPASVLSYAWAQQYGLPTDGSADNTDTDADGLNNWQEWKSGTVPTNSASVLQLASPSNNISGMVVTWQSVSGLKYYLQRGTNLAAQSPFTSIVSNLIGQPVTTSYTDPTATNSGPYFYRVGVQ